MITSLRDRNISIESKKLHKIFLKLQTLLEDLNKRELPSDISILISEKVEKINRFNGTEKELRKAMSKTYRSIIELIRKELQLVPKGYHRTTWMSLGMSVFGIPMGLAFSAAIDNYAFLAIGIPIGMSIGMALGQSMDEKAAQEGRQLDLVFG